MYLAMDGGGTDSFLWRSLDNGITWNDKLAHQWPALDHRPRDGSGNLLSYGGKNSQINAYMPRNLSVNWGATWSAPTQSPFPQLGSNQRPSLWRLTNGKLMMVGDSQLKGTPTPPAGWTNGPGATSQSRRTTAPHGGSNRSRLRCRTKATNWLEHWATQRCARHPMGSSICLRP